MVRRLVFALILLIIETGVATAEEATGLTYFLSGRDAEGHTLFDRFELYPNGKILWQVASKGGVCANEAGVFKGVLTPSETKKILEAADQIYKSSKSFKKIDSGDNDSTRQARHLLQVEYRDAVYPLQVEHGGKEVSQFFEELAFLKAKLKPESAVRMLTNWEKKDKDLLMHVTFKALGDIPFRLVLPKKAADTFFVPDGVAVEYFTQPKNLDVMLGTKDNLEVWLKVNSKNDHKNLSKKPPLYYDSGSMLHHGLKNLRKKTPQAMEIFLCSESPLLEKAGGPK